MELTKQSIILYQRCYCLERKEDIPLTEVSYEVKTDTLLSVTLLFNRLDGLYVMLKYKDYEFFEEIHWITPSNNYVENLYPTLESLDIELNKIVKQYIGIDLLFENTRGTMLFNLLLMNDLSDMQ